MIVRIPATSANLGPGFDSLGLALCLYNDFIVKPSILQSIKIKGEGEKIPKLIKDNNFIKIFKEIYTSLSGEESNFSFYLKNNIPISRGLGSSSAVIVGAIVCAYEILKIPYTKDVILQKALKYEKHPDNITPACIGGFNTTMIKNNRVFYTKTKIPPDIKAVIVIPNKPISTKYSRKTLPKQISLNDAIFNISRSSMISSIFAQKKWNLLKFASEDKIHQDKRMSLLPILFNVKKEAIKNGALMSVLSGSGSTFLNICYKNDASKLALALSKKFYDFRVLELDFDNNGISIL
ncbi:homoserine kinase [Helicobacter sp. MIT 14-3879]|uniref:homoserine kinase n=1 Tax=Helicobacter sp. MIT 14-3879 TaxID=2040649 RepID=UPI000E1F6298|nr:homoserine kinase [Helicobacter sp. MIT 14-3879]RDU65608.1 homoserine kinase [Helicobacter sp. MIT 14-3879]